MVKCKLIFCVVELTEKHMDYISHNYKYCYTSSDYWWVLNWLQNLLDASQLQVTIIVYRSLQFTMACTKSSQSAVSSPALTAASRGIHSSSSGFLICPHASATAPLDWLTNQLSTTTVKVKVMLWLTVSQPVCLCVRHALEARDQTFITARQLQVIFMYGCPLWWEDLSVVYPKCKSKLHCDLKLISWCVLVLSPRPDVCYCLTVIFLCLWGAISDKMMGISFVSHSLQY
jgi:hypothetical protein